MSVRPAVHSSSPASLREDELVEVDMTVEAGAWPDPPAIEDIAKQAIAAVAGVAGQTLTGREVSVVLTDDAGIRRLNAAWRKKDRPTNVLSFPQPPGPLLGDIVLGYETVAEEAAIAEKPLHHHIAHLVVHGFLHLLGYDHEENAEAERMEQLERVALARLGVPDPYGRHPIER